MRLTQNVLQLPFFFFFSLFLVWFLDGLTKVLLLSSVSSSRHMWPISEVLHWAHREIIVYIFKLRVCEHSMPCAVEINSNGRSKQGHANLLPLNHKKHHVSTTTMRGDLPWGALTHKITWFFDCVVLRDNVTN